jgi:hypothetical protein
MSCFLTSTTTRVDGEWLFTAHVRTPLYAGARIRFQERWYPVAEDLTVKVKFSAKDSLDAQEVSRRIGNQIDAAGATIREGRQASSIALHAALTKTIGALDRACESGFLGQVAGSCAFAAYLADLQVKKSLPQMSSCVRAGDGETTGFFDAAGNSHAHYWVEIDDGNERFVADIAADLFGGEPIIVLPLVDAAAFYVPADEGLALERMAALQERIASAAPSDSTASPERAALYTHLWADKAVMSLLT